LRYKLGYIGKNCRREETFPYFLPLVYHLEELQTSCRSGIMKIGTNLYIKTFYGLFPEKVAWKTYKV